MASFPSLYIQLIGEVTPILRVVPPCHKTLKRAVLPISSSGSQAVFYRIVVDIIQVTPIVVFVAEAMLIIAFLPNRFVSPCFSAWALREMFVKIWIAMLAEVSLDVTDDLWIVLGFLGCENHVKMIGKNHDGIDPKAVSPFCIPESFAKQGDILKEDRIASIGNDRDEIAVSVFENPSVVGHG